MGTGTGIGRVRGYGAAGKVGTEHFMLQRLTGLSNAGLATWFVLSQFLLPDHSYESVIEWIRQPLSSVLLALLILSVIIHIRMGLQTLIEDYSKHGTRLFLLIAMNFGTIVAAALGWFSLARIVFIR